MTGTNAITTTTIVDFLRGIGIGIEATSLPADGQLPAMTVRDGVLLYDPDQLEYPGDLLHDAGHIAVTDPALRATAGDATFGAVETAEGDEMAAMAWSYAAALAIGIDPFMVFHDGGYKGGGGYLAENFAAGRYVGVPMLQYYGLAARTGEGELYPTMQRWLR